MKWLQSSKISLGFIAFIAAFVISTGPAKADFIWGTPTILGPSVNSPYGEHGVCISANGLEFYFVSDRPGGYGGYDLWIRKRPTIQDDWGSPVCLGSPANTQYSYWEPTISADGLSLYFSDGHAPQFGNPLPGGFNGDGDIWMLARETVHDAWGAPVNIGPTVNSQHAVHPSISADGLSLYFQSHRPGHLGDHCDIMVATRETTSDSFGAPVFLRNVNSADGEWMPDISADGQTLFFCRKTCTELWMATRATMHDDFDPPLKLPPQINIPSCTNASPSLSADASTLYFSSDRPGGIGGYDLWQVSITPIVDFDGDGIVNLKDFSKLAQYWGLNESSVDIAPAPVGDGKIDYKDLAVLSEHWLETETVYIQWLVHSSVKVWAGDVIIYIDPRNLSTSPHDANAVLVTHSHSDHYQPADIAKASGPTTKFVAPADVVALYGKGQAIRPGQMIQLDGFNVIGVPAYNTNHPRSNSWLGYIIELASKRIYIAGDTDLIEEMKTLGHIDVAILPAGGTYTMNAQQAADATKYIKPLLAIPYHWGGGIVGTLADAQRFANLAACNVKIMSAGEILSSQDWLKDFSLIAHWKLDDAEGTTAVDSAGAKNGTVNGNPLWQPAGGKIDGALLLDGDGDYVSTPFILNPASGPFSVFAWIKGGAPGEVILSQITGVSWLSAESGTGNLMTELKPSSGRNNLALSSQTSIIDNNWHRVGLVWDGSYRILYVDDVVAAKDTAPQSTLTGSTGGLYIGAEKSLNAAGFWNSLIDDVRIHNRVVTP